MVSPDASSPPNSLEAPRNLPNFDYIAGQIGLATLDTLNLLGPLIKDCYFGPALNQLDPQAAVNTQQLLGLYRDRRQQLTGDTKPQRSDIIRDCFDGLIPLTPEVIKVIRRPMGFSLPHLEPEESVITNIPVPTLTDELIGPQDPDIYTLVKYYEGQMMQLDGSSKALLNYLVEKIAGILVNSQHSNAFTIISEFRNKAAVLRRNYLSPVIDFLPKELIQEEIDNGSLPADILAPKEPISFQQGPI